tara:strand:+ start:11007 stop:11714 length:708 start_codon:yes stop_codon:yes gene_type:complete
VSWLLANWKANTDLQTYLKLVSMIPDGSSTTIIIPPHPYIWPVSKVLPAGVKLGAQDVSIFESGAHTGEVTSEMLKEMGVSHVLVGHSERRSSSDTFGIVDRKLSRILSENLIPIICCGMDKVPSTQEDITQLADMIPSLDKCAEAFIAFEPIFAIGTGITPSIEQIDDVLKKLAVVLRSRYPKCKLNCLYGGSVNSNNIEKINALSSCDGVLVGSSSLNEKQWEHLIKSCKISS